MKRTFFVIFVLVSVGADLFGTELRDVLAHPEKFENRRITVAGIARVPGYFYLCADQKAAADRHPEKAILVRKTNRQREYREMDRQWVEVTGVVSNKACDGYEVGSIWELPPFKQRPGILLEHLRFLRDRPPPRIKDSTVWAIFKNSTSVPLAVELVPRIRPGVVSELYLAPQDTQATEIDEGRATASRLKGPDNLRLDERKIGERIATGDIKLRSLPRGWEYSPELSKERTVYYEIVDHRIESVASSEGRRWKVR